MIRSYDYSNDKGYCFVYFARPFFVLPSCDYIMIKSSCRIALLSHLSISYHQSIGNHNPVLPDASIMKMYSQDDTFVIRYKYK